MLKSYIMKKYLDEIFGLCVKIENWNGKNNLPLFLRNKREYYVMSIENKRSILMKNNSDNFNISGFKKEINEIEKTAGMSAILWLDAVSTYQRNALIKSRIPFIVPNSQIYVPELGMCLKELCVGKMAKVEKISAISQYLLLYFVYQKKLKKISQSELAVQLNMSAMNVSRAVQNLQALGLLDTHKEGTSKLVKPVAIGKDLYQLSNDYLQSPVQKKIYVNSMHFDMDLPYAGETALAKQSILNFPRCTVFAMDKKLAKDIPKEYLVDPKLVADSDYVEIELWKYDPKMFVTDGMVDIVSLVQSLKGINDERVEMQMKEIMEEYKW